MSVINTEQLAFDKLGGLIPAIIQDQLTKKVLMLGFMNKEALQKSIDDQVVTFWSRSKNRLWQKGETSGNILNISSITADCDNDTLLISVNPSGPCCHSGDFSCFDSHEDTLEFLPILFQTINKRKQELPAHSYTTSLFKKGTAEINNKILEEANEVIFATTNETRQRLIEESCDLLFHLLVLLAEKEISLEEINAELLNRSLSS